MGGLGGRPCWVKPLKTRERHSQPVDGFPDIYQGLYEKLSACRGPELLSILCSPCSSLTAKKRVGQIITPKPAVGEPRTIFSDLHGCFLWYSTKRTTCNSGHNLIAHHISCRWEKGSPVPLSTSWEKNGSRYFFLSKSLSLAIGIGLDTILAKTSCHGLCVVFPPSYEDTRPASKFTLRRHTSGRWTWGELKKEGSGCVRRYINQITRGRRYEECAFVGHPLTLFVWPLNL